jgi:O-methyltransferase domain
MHCESRPARSTKFPNKYQTFQSASLGLKTFWTIRAHRFRYGVALANGPRIWVLRVDLLTLKLAFEVKAVYSLRAALYIVKLLMFLHKLSTAAAQLQIIVPVGDAYLLKHILVDWRDNECVQVLKGVRESMLDGARVLVIEMIIELADATASLNSAILMDIMMTMCTGRERTNDELKSVFAKASLVESGCVTLLSLVLSIRVK